MNDSDRVFILYKTPYKSKYVHKYGYELGTPEKLTHIREQFYAMDSMHKPVKSLSAYKVSDLVSIAAKLHLADKKENGKPLSKTELYEAISNYFVL